MKKILLFCSITIILFSCDGLLKENPQALAVETFYNTAGEVEAGVAAIYDPLRSTFAAEYISLLETMSDFMSGRASWENAGLYDVVLNTQNSTRSQTAWTNFYRSIRNANLVIENVPNSAILNESDKNKYIGEAKFLRALTYFHLIRNWGAIPLRTEENFSELNVPRTPIEDVYKLIISDLKHAESGLLDVPEVSGHPSKWSATTVLADVYFYLAQYDEASAKSNEVIKSGKYSLEEVSEPEDFENLFGAAIVNSSEEIFYIKYNNDRPWNYPRYLHGIGVPYVGYDGYYAITSNENYIQNKNWDNNDMRKIYGWYAYEGYDPSTLLCKKFNDYGSLTPSNDYPLYRYADLLLIYAEASCRANNNPTTDGLEALNKIHRRGYGYPPDQKSSIDFEMSDFNNIEAFIDGCIQERGYETIAEGKRWFDLRRLGKEKAREIIQEMRGINIHEGKFLFPIPLNEYEYNEAITDQNPGY